MFHWSSYLPLLHTFFFSLDPVSTSSLLSLSHTQIMSLYHDFQLMAIYLISNNHISYFHDLYNQLASVTAHDRKQRCICSLIYVQTSKVPLQKNLLQYTIMQLPIFMFAHINNILIHNTGTKIDIIFIKTCCRCQWNIISIFYMMWIAISLPPSPSLKCELLYVYKHGWSICVWPQHHCNGYWNTGYRRLPLEYTWL